MNLTVKNNIGEQFNITVVRYFKFNGGNYLIFTKNEMDEAGYQKLYISKISNMVGNNIDDEVEWNLVRDTIKVIAKANKDNTILPVQDLSETEINGIQIMGQKPFKLTVSSVSLLGANKNTQPVVNSTVAPQSPVIASTQPVVSVPPVAPVTSVDTLTNVVEAVPVQPVVDYQVAQTPVVESAVNPVNPTVASIETPIASVNPVVEPTPQPVVSNIAPSVESVVAPNAGIPSANSVPVTPIDPFNFSMPTVPSTPVETVDYKKLYEEQTLKLNALTVELDKYRSIIEQLKNILN